MLKIELLKKKSKYNEIPFHPISSKLSPLSFEEKEEKKKKISQRCNNPGGGGGRRVWFVHSPPHSTYLIGLTKIQKIGSRCIYTFVHFLGRPSLSRDHHPPHPPTVPRKNLTTHSSLPLPLTTATFLSHPRRHSLGSAVVAPVVRGRGKSSP